MPGEQPVTHRGGREERARAFGQALQGGPGARQDGAAAGQQHRTLRAPEQVGERGDGRRRRRGSERLAGSHGAPVGPRARLALYVQRQHQHHGAPLDDGPPQRPADVLGGRVGAEHAVGGGADGLHHRGLLDTEVGAQRGGGRVAREDDQRRAALRRLRDPGHRVREPGALVHAAHAEPPGHARVRVGHASGSALVARGDEAPALVDECRGDREVPAADDAERDVAAGIEHAARHHVDDGRP